MTYGEELRVGDEERDAAANRVREAYVEGRLTYEELDDRLDVIHRAKTRSDLRTVSADLPTVKKNRRKRSLVPWTYIEVNAVLWAIWGAQSLQAGSPTHPWPLVVTVPWGVVEALGIARRASRRRAAPPSNPELRAS